MASASPQVPRDGKERRQQGRRKEAAQSRKFTMVWVQTDFLRLNDGGLICTFQAVAMPIPPNTKVAEQEEATEGQR